MSASSTSISFKAAVLLQCVLAVASALPMAGCGGSGSDAESGGQDFSAKSSTATPSVVSFTCGKATVTVHDGGKTLDWSDDGDPTDAVTSSRDSKQSASTRTSYGSFDGADNNPTVVVDNSMLSGQPGTMNVTFAGDGAPKAIKSSCTPSAAPASTSGSSKPASGTLTFSCGKAKVVIHDGGKTLDWSDDGDDTDAVTSARDAKQTVSQRTTYSSFENADNNPTVIIDSTMLSGKSGTMNVTFAGDGAPKAIKATCTPK